jgi:2-polyprenyl-3-methyl-5-hydroxy-6-metoxy-1,4-benzoquinol methylase
VEIEVARAPAFPAPGLYYFGHPSSAFGLFLRACAAGVPFAHGGRPATGGIAAALNGGSRVLEIAPGPGLFAIALAKLAGGRVTGLDISHTFVQIAGR